MPAIKMLPSNLEAEKAVLGAMMIRNGEAISEIQGVLSPEEFFEEKHRIIYTAMIEVYEKRGAVDVITMDDYLATHGLLDKVGGLQFVMYLGNNIQTNANIVAHAQIVKNKYKLRRLIEIGEKLADEAYSNTAEINDIISGAEQEIFEIGSIDRESSFEHIESIMLRVHEHVNAIFNSGDKTTGLKTSYEAFDKLAGGLHKSDFVIIAARPSMGKTALAINIANNIAGVKMAPDNITLQRGSLGKVALFSLEMSKEQLGHRLLSMESNIDSQKLHNGQLTEAEWLAMQYASDRLARSEIYIDDTPALTVGEVRARARRLQLEQGLDLLIIDYLQLMSSSFKMSRETNRQQEISEISRSLKALARELDIPVIALSQLSRAVELRAEKKPQLSDLRESGSLEQDADVVMFLYRESYYKSEVEDQALTELIVAKNRNGPTGVINLHFRRETMTFTSMESSRVGG